MAKNVKFRQVSFLPGAGYDSTGNPKQGKTRVTGIVSVTAYAPGNERLSARDIGLTNIDFINLRVSDETGHENAQSVREVNYVKSVGIFYLIDVSSGGVRDERASGATETIEFVAEGDSARDVELV
jgi:hypothetical protein